MCGEAANGLQAVQMADKLDPDVVLLDFQMPVMDGLSAAREIRKVKPLLPIAMYTLHQNSHFDKQAAAVGVQKVISKDDIFSRLTASLSELVADCPRQNGAS